MTILSVRPPWRARAERAAQTVPVAEAPLPVNEPTVEGVAPETTPGPAGAWPPAGGPSRWLVTLVAGTAYLVAAYLGRLTVPEGSELSLIWPANGVIAVWFALLGWRRSLAVDAALLFSLSMLVNHLTGVPLVLALDLALFAVAIGVVFGLVLTLAAPRLWGPRSAHDGPTLRTGRDVALVLLAGVVACVLATLVTVQVTWRPLLAGDPSSGAQLAVRNLAGIIAIVPVALLARDRWLARRAHGPRSATAARAGAAGAAGAQSVRSLELVALYLLTGLLVGLVLGTPERLPLSFVVLATSVWAGLRLSPLAANVHAVVLATTVVVASVLGRPGFVPFGDPRETASVTQLWVGFVIGMTMALALDAAERRRLTSELVAARSGASEQAETLSRVLGAMAEGVVLIAEDGTVLLRNAAGARLTGGGAAAVGTHVDRRRMKVLRPDGEETTVAGLLRTLARGAAGSPVGVSEPHDLVVVPTEGAEPRRLEVRASAVRGSGGRPATLVVYHDVTAERRERDGLASFAGVVAHDLVNPLSTVSGWTEVLRGQVASLAGDEPVPPSASRALARIQTATDGMRDLIDDLLSFVTSRDAPLARDAVDLGAIAAEVAARWSEEPVGGGRPRIGVGPLPPVAGDTGQLRQVLDNLVGNAVKYVAPGVVPTVTLHGHRSGEVVVVDIADNGIGIPDDQLDAVFDSFHRAHRDGYRGTGLGLSIVRSTVERHGGTVVATRRAGGGTVFRLTLPAAPLPGAPVDAAPTDTGRPDRA